MKHLTDTLREALEAAQNGLKWYRDTYPDADSQADDEMNAEIEEALTALSELDRMAVEPVAWTSQIEMDWAKRNPGRAGSFYAVKEGPSSLPLYTAAPLAQQPQYEAGDMASAHNDGFRAGVASVAQQPQAEPISVSCRCFDEVSKRLCADKNRCFQAVAASAAPQQAEAVRWCPDVCPITGKPFFMWIGHPKHGEVPTYGGPYDSYTIPVRHEDGSFCCERYDHDNGGWVTDEVHDVGVQIVSDQAYVSDEAPQQAEAVPSIDALEQEIYENTREFVSRSVMEWMLQRYYPAAPPQAEAVHHKPVRVCHIKDVACSEAAVKCGECPDAAPQQAEAVPVLTESELRSILQGTNHMVKNAMHGAFWPELEEACRAIERAMRTKLAVPMTDGQALDSISRAKGIGGVIRTDGQLFALVREVERHHGIVGKEGA